MGLAGAWPNQGKGLPKCRRGAVRGGESGVLYGWNFLWERLTKKECLNAKKKKFPEQKVLWEIFNAGSAGGLAIDQWNLRGGRGEDQGRMKLRRQGSEFFITKVRRNARWAKSYNWSQNWLNFVREG